MPPFFTASRRKQKQKTTTTTKRAGVLLLKAAASGLYACSFMPTCVHRSTWHPARLSVGTLLMLQHIFYSAAALKLQPTIYYYILLRIFAYLNCYSTYFLLFLPSFSHLALMCFLFSNFLLPTFLLVIASICARTHSSNYTPAHIYTHAHTYIYAYVVVAVKLCLKVGHFW